MDPARVAAHEPYHLSALAQRLHSLQLLYGFGFLGVRSSFEHHSGVVLAIGDEYIQSTVDVTYTFFPRASAKGFS